jgi:curved DNA-binding protein CbpA
MNVGMPLDLYERLGVPRNASTEVIKRAYRRLSSLHHPDKGGTVEQFQLINEAYEILTNDARREQYDETGTTKEKMSENELLKMQLGNLLLQILGTASINHDTRDVVQLMRDTLNFEREAHLESIGKLNSDMRRVKRIIPRITRDGGADFLTERLHVQVKKFEASVQDCQQAINNIDVMLGMLADYKYKTDEPIAQDVQAGFWRINGTSI